MTNKQRASVPPIDQYIKIFKVEKQTIAKQV